MARHYAITFAFLAATLLCYASGVRSGYALFLVLGVIFEGTFWVRLFKGKPEAGKYSE